MPRVFFFLESLQEVLYFGELARYAEIYHLELERKRLAKLERSRLAELAEKAFAKKEQESMLEYLATCPICLDPSVQASLRCDFCEHAYFHRSCAAMVDRCPICRGNRVPKNTHFAREMTSEYFDILVAEALREKKEEREEKARKHMALHVIKRAINKNNCLCVLRDKILVAKSRRKDAVHTIWKFLKWSKTRKIKLFIGAFYRALLPQNSRKFFEFQVKMPNKTKITLYMLNDETSFLDGAIFNYYTLQPVYDGSKKGVESMFNKPSNLKFPKALRNNPKYFFV